MLGAYEGMEGIPSHLGKGQLVEWEHTEKLLNKLPLLGTPSARASPVCVRGPLVLQEPPSLRAGAVCECTAIQMNVVLKEHFVCMRSKGQRGQQQQTRSLRAAPASHIYCHLTNEGVFVI